MVPIFALINRCTMTMSVLFVSHAMFEVMVMFNGATRHPLIKIFSHRSLNILPIKNVFRLFIASGVGMILNVLAVSFMGL